MRTKPPAALPIFRSETQAQLLALLFLQTGREWTGPDLQRRLGTPEATFRREVNRLLKAGLVESTAVGRTKTYRAAAQSPLYEPLRDLLERTLGVEAQLRTQLTSLQGVEVAAIFGSWARGNVNPESDIDVLVVGDAVDYDEVLEVARRVEETGGRLVNPVIYSRDEFQEKVEKDNKFVKNVLQGELKPLVGDVEALKVASHESSTG